MKYGRKYVNDYRIVFDNNIKFTIDSVIEEKIMINKDIIKGYFIYALNEQMFIKTLINSTCSKLDIISLVRDVDSGKDNEIIFTIPYPTISYIDKMDNNKDINLTKIEFKGTTIIKEEKYER